MFTECLSLIVRHCLIVASLSLSILKDKHTNQIYEDFLVRLSENQIYEWLSKSKHKELVSMVRGVLLKYRSDQGNLQQLGIRTENVLKKIASEDRFNQIKISTLYRINI